MCVCIRDILGFEVTCTLSPREKSEYQGSTCYTCRVRNIHYLELKTDCKSFTSKWIVFIKESPKGNVPNRERRHLSAQSDAQTVDVNVLEISPWQYKLRCGTRVHDVVLLPGILYKVILVNALLTE